VGVAFGQFTNNAEDGDAEARPMADVLQECADALAVPAVSGIPCGHIDDQWTLPFGALATLDAAAKSLMIHP
jgi:muramoyltetrapeptide carboxypeptidase